MNIQFDECGQGVLEYALIAVSISLVVLLALSLTGVSLKDTYCKVVNSVGGRAAGAHLILMTPLIYLVGMERSRIYFISKMGRLVSRGMEKEHCFI
jgi:Flp pilus assembly pilin Flp